MERVQRSIGRGHTRRVPLAAAVRVAEQSRRRKCACCGGRANATAGAIATGFRGLFLVLVLAIVVIFDVGVGTTALARGARGGGVDVRNRRERRDDCGVAAKRAARRPGGTSVEKTPTLAHPTIPVV